MCCSKRCHNNFCFNGRLLLQPWMNYGEGLADNVTSCHLCSLLSQVLVSGVTVTPGGVASLQHGLYLCVSPFFVVGHK